jgi:redox-sensitive bicupin YhaK (pirin superfamily)
LSAFALRIFKRESKLKIIKRNILRRGGFAGLRETRLVMSPSIFRSRREAGTSTGIGRFCYLADASFLPNGETRMHTHSDIDVISVMVKGCIKHEGSMENGQELHVDDIQVQRAGSEGFSHNEINPDDSKNRMIQLWVLPETKEEPASYQMFHAQPGERMRVYGGPPDQDETFAARTIIDIAHVNAGESVSQSGRSLAYMVEGSGKSLQEVIREGDLVECRDFAFKASADSKLILVFEI